MFDARIVVMRKKIQKFIAVKNVGLYIVEGVKVVVTIVLYVMPITHMSGLLR